MKKYPSEIFGYYWQNNSPEAKSNRKKHFCPFHDSTCFKQSRLIDFPFGVCTAHYDGAELALCPRRFLENATVFRDIAKHHFKNINDILVFSEVGLKGIGNFDFVMIKHKPMSIEIEDFVVIEFQTGQTTSTGKLVEAFSEYLNTGHFNQKLSYGFGINSYDIWKRSFAQILNKGIILEKWKKKIYWVVQDQIFQYFQKKYRLNTLKYHDSHSTIFALYDFKKTESSLALYQTRIFSSTIDDLFNAFRQNDEIPPVEEFISRIQTKIQKDMNLSLRLDVESTKKYIDTPKPSSTGRIKDDSKEFGVS
ncbi:hypothetical protein GF406_20875 [candidate division KSB1 bacterium]|nr:hypothetical protein [candidate division KSB1 bacterium]